MKFRESKFTELEAKNANELIKLAEKRLKVITSQYEVTGRIRQETQQTLQDFKKFIRLSNVIYKNFIKTIIVKVC